jgi:hypothetical protein
MAITDFLFNPTTITELVALIAAMLLLPAKNKYYPGAFLYYLVFVLVIEISGFYFRSLKIPNAYLYNILNLVQALFFTWIFMLYRRQQKAVKEARIIAAVLLTAFAAETLYRLLNLPVQEHYNKYFRILLAVVVVSFSLVFYARLLREDTIINPLTLGRFWIVTGLFCFYLCSTPMSSLEEQVAKIKLSGNLTFYTLVMGCINVVLYGSWVIAFICLRKKPSSKRSSLPLLSLR